MTSIAPFPSGAAKIAPATKVDRCARQALRLQLPEIQRGRQLRGFSLTLDFKEMALELCMWFPIVMLTCWII